MWPAALNVNQPQTTIQTLKLQFGQALEQRIRLQVTRHFNFSQAVR